MNAPSNSRKLTILAQDPAVRLHGKLAFTQVSIPNEVLADGPIGYRVKVVDFDATANVLYEPLRISRDSKSQSQDQFEPNEKWTLAQRKRWEKKVLSNQQFHAQNVYAIVMRTLARFEFALGRRVAWSFGGHQINIAPHAFCEANAFYSEEDQALFFGYFVSSKSGRTVYSCLSHDIVAHETTHALLDGLRDGFTNPSSPDQAAFHEGFADVVALLSIFSLSDIVEAALLPSPVGKMKKGPRLIATSAVTRDAIINSILLGLGKEFGRETDGARADCLRRSVELKPRTNILDSPEFQEEHDRGEVFAAAMLRSFLAMWLNRIAKLGTFEGDKYNLEMVIEEGTKAADNLLTMAIRALDYCPPVDLTFGDYLAALLTADSEAAPDDLRFRYRKVIKDTFASYGMVSTPDRTDPESGRWLKFSENESITYSQTHYESMLHDKEEVFRFLWENRDALGITDLGYLRVNSVRPSFRQGPDGFFLRETVCEYVQVVNMFGAEAGLLGIKRPEGMPTTQAITAYGGGTLVFDQYGRIKYHVAQRVTNVERQARRINYLWERGLLGARKDARNRFAAIHRCRVL